MIIGTLLYAKLHKHAINLFYFLSFPLLKAAFSSLHLRFSFWLVVNVPISPEKRRDGCNTC